MIQIKKLKGFTMMFDPEHHQVLIEKDKVYFTIEKNEIFPICRGIFSVIQKFWRRKYVPGKTL